jgi:hypothetical protein
VGSNFPTERSLHMAFKSVFDPDFKYRNADTTDVRLTFERIKREQRKAQRRSEDEANVSMVVRLVPAAPDVPASGA